MFDPFDPNGELRNQAKAEQQAAELRNALNAVAEYIPQLSRMYFMYYEALLKAGFNEQQALYLVGQHGSTLGVHFNK